MVKGLANARRQLLKDMVDYNIFLQPMTGKGLRMGRDQAFGNFAFEE